MIFVAKKMVGPKKFFSSSSFGAVVGSGMDKNQIRDKHPGPATLRIRIHSTALWYADL
jgi:hypothetical protein